MEWAREMAKRLNSAVNGEKNVIMDEYQAMTGKSVPTLYRIAARHGFSSDRQHRRDKGELRCGINDEQLQFVSALISESARQVKGTIMPLSTAMEIAVDNGVIEKGQISEARMQAILREREMNSTALNTPAPSIKMASLHPNHVHVFDSSICIQYYLKSGKGLRIMDERDFREKKPDNFAKIKDHILRVVLADHFSHCLHVKYYQAAGENQQNIFDFLCSAWRGGEHEKLAMRGVPFFILMDAGSANMAKGLQELFKRLEIELPKNMPHNPRRQGSAECAQQLVETHFESRLRFEPATSIEQLNSWCLDWLVHWNGRQVHRRHGMTRMGCWLKHIRQEMIRDLPADDILRDLYAEPEVERTVRSDNTITFRGEEYRIKHVEGIRPGKKVQVVLRPYHWPEVAVVFNGKTYLAQPSGRLAGGFSADAAIIGQEYKAQPETMVQQALKTNANRAYGEERGKNDLPFAGSLRVFGHQAEKIASIPMPRRGTPMEVSRPAEDAAISIIELFKRLRMAGITIDPATNQALRAEFGSSIAVDRADQVVAAMSDGCDWHGGELQRRLAL